MTLGILDGDDAEASFVLLNVHECSHSSGVASSSQQDESSYFELDNGRHLSSLDADFDSVVDLCVWVRIANGASVVGDSDRYLVLSDVDLVDSAELVGSLVLLDAVADKASLGVEHDAEDVARLFQLHNVHDSGGEVVVRSHLSVDLDTAFHAYLHALLVGEGVLEAFTEDNGNRNALAKLVRSRGRADGEDTAHLSQVPRMGRVQALEMFRGTASPVKQK